MEPKDEGPSGANFHLFSRIESNDISGVRNSLEIEDADVNARSQYASPMIHGAIMVGAGHLMKDFACSTRTGDTPLIFAVRHGFIDIVELLIEKGADVDARNPDTNSGKTALMIAREKGHAGIIDILETSGAGSD
jgi:hypothetical protein